MCDRHRFRNWQHCSSYARYSVSGSQITQSESISSPFLRKKSRRRRTTGGRGLAACLQRYTQILMFNYHKNYYYYYHCHNPIIILLQLLSILLYIQINKPCRHAVSFKKNDPTIPPKFRRSRSWPSLSLLSFECPPPDSTLYALKKKLRGVPEQSEGRRGKPKTYSREPELAQNGDSLVGIVGLLVGPIAYLLTVEGHRAANAEHDGATRYETERRLACRLRRHPHHLYQQLLLASHHRARNLGTLWNVQGC